MGIIRCRGGAPGVKEERSLGESRPRKLLA
jgi:hypothetical protein